jgi:hypothetical protein
MPGRPYVGHDNRPYTPVVWTPGAGSPSKTLDFLIDTGATRSGIDATNAIGLRLVALVTTTGYSGTSSQVLLFGGGQMQFEVEDSKGTEVVIIHHGDVLMIGQCLIGQEVIRAHSLRLNVDYSADPPEVRLTL